MEKSGKQVIPIMYYIYEWPTGESKIIFEKGEFGVLQIF